MKTIKTLKIATLGTAALVLATPAISHAEVEQATATSSGNGHSLVHRVSHSLAAAKSYTNSGTSGYKWGKDLEPSSSSAEWAASSNTRSSYKWGNSSTGSADTQSYAGTSYQWGTKGFSEQAGYRWGMKAFSDQAGYRWGMKTFSDQAGYRWGMKSYARQAHHSFVSQ